MVQRILDNLSLKMISLTKNFVIAGLVLVALSLASAQNDSDFYYGSFPDDFEWGTLGLKITFHVLCG